MRVPQGGVTRRGASAGRGFTYLGLMFLVAMLSLTGAMAATAWSFVQQRSNERELVFVGRQFQTAIERYHQRAKPPARPYPLRLEDLLFDDRSITVERHLRKIFVDPMTGEARWGLVRLPGGGIVGVYSLSGRQTLKRQAVAPGIESPQGRTYRDWRFIAPSALEAVEALQKLPASGPSVPGN